VAAGVPVGVIGSRALSRSMAVFLNFDIPSFSVPAWIFLLVGAVGILVPVAAAAWPVVKGSTISVRAALGDSGVSRTVFGVSGLERRIAGVRGLARPMLLAIRNGFRRHGRTALTVGTLAASGVFFMAAMNVRGSMVRTLDRLFEGRKYDLSVHLSALSPEAAVDRALRKTPGIVRSERWLVVEGSVPRDGHEPRTGEPVRHPAGGDAENHGGAVGRHGGGGVALAADRFPMIALPPDTQLIALRIIEGRGLRAGETGTLVANEALAARDLRIRVGGTVVLRTGPAEVPWRVVGIAREPLSPPVAYVSKAFFDAFHPGMTSDLRLALARTDPRSIDRLKEALETNLEAEGVRVAASGSKAESRFGLDQHMLMIYVFLVIVSCLLGGVGALGLATTMSLSVIERRREIAVMRAIGATPFSVAAILVGEGVCLGLLGWGAAALAAWPIARGVGNALGTLLFHAPLDFRFDARGPAIGLAVSLGLGAAASLVPALRAGRRPIREGLEYE
jgi:putative ABC transport system permease protein